MDVQRIATTGIGKPAPKSSTKTSASVSFSEVMSGKRDQAAEHRLRELMGKIEDQGKTLSETRTVEELRKYKQLIKEFVGEAVEHGLSLEEKRGFNRRGRTKIYKIVEQVDQKLLDLTNAVLEKEKKGLDILDMVGEIKGLLINIYA
ncbi:YaaR family protein [Alkalihalobacillus sp. 1P02AB]|uniref:YaaR family protein n=1 Tax=Alkalihalobacillus sp. 1P02AB TaxID=3132260 RepID=UPI0039A419DB